MASTTISLQIFNFYFVVSYGSLVASFETDVSQLTIRGFRFETTPFWEAKTHYLTACAQACIRRKICRSFNFNEKTKVCQLNENFGTPSLKEKHGMYGELRDLPSQVDPNCFGRPCTDDELCIPMSLKTGETCAYSCFKMARSCPLPSGGSTIQPRTVGSVFTCGPGNINGNESAVCLPDGTWNRPLRCEGTINSTTTNNTMLPFAYNTSCVSAAECTIHNTACIESRCQCSLGYRHSLANDTCTKDCTTYGTTFTLIPDHAFDIEPILGTRYRITVEDCKAYCSGFNDCTGFTYCAGCTNMCRCKIGSILDYPGQLFEHTGVDYYIRNCA